MAGGSLGGDEEDLISGINVTPLVDVVLVLLIILMVTAQAIASKTIPMELPNAVTAESTEDTPTTLGISIEADGSLYLDREEVSEAEFRRLVAQAASADENTRAIIAASGEVPHRNVVRIIDILRQLQVTKFAINVNQSDLEAEEE